MVLDGLILFLEVVEHLGSEGLDGSPSISERIARGFFDVGGGVGLEIVGLVEKLTSEEGVDEGALRTRTIE